MTQRPATYEGFKEKFFWFAVSLIGTGVVAMVGLMWGLTIDMQIIKAKENQATQTDKERMDIIQKTLDMSSENNRILNTKADALTNENEHKQIIVQLDDMAQQLHRVIMRMYGEVIRPDTTYLITLLDTVVPIVKLPVLIKPKKKI